MLSGRIFQSSVGEGVGSLWWLLVARAGRLEVSADVAGAAPVYGLAGIETWPLPLSIAEAFPTQRVQARPTDIEADVSSTFP